MKRNKSLSEIHEYNSPPNRLPYYHEDEEFYVEKVRVKYEEKERELRQLLSDQLFDEQMKQLDPNEQVGYRLERELGTDLPHFFFYREDSNLCNSPLSTHSDPDEDGVNISVYSRSSINEGVNTSGYPFIEFVPGKGHTRFY